MLWAQSALQGNSGFMNKIEATMSSWKVDGKLKVIAIMNFLNYKVVRYTNRELSPP